MHVSYLTTHTPPSFEWGTEPISHYLIQVTITRITHSPLSITAMAEDKPCTLTLPDGTHYDLTSLSSASADYTAEVGETSYKLNICRNVVSEIWGLDDADKVGGFVNRPNGDFSLGSVLSCLCLGLRGVWCTNL
jgi:hypothetical protein